MMINPDTLKRAVELAIGFEWLDYNYIKVDLGVDHLPVVLPIDTPVTKAALAAQLVRQVEDAGYEPVTRRGHTIIRGIPNYSNPVASAQGDDRTKNTINAIVLFANANPGVM